MAINTKSEIRERMRSLRNAIEDDARGLYDMLIFDRAHKARAFQLAERVHVFMNADGEPKTMPFVEYALGIGKDVFVPVVEQGIMRHVQVTFGTTWTHGAFGIAEPVERGTMVPDEHFRTASAVVVPLVAFTANCHRLGFGKGYYDRFLAACGAPAIGIAYDVQRVDVLPVEDHDVPLMAIATEQRWYTPQ